MTSRPVRWVGWIFLLACIAVALALAGRHGVGYAVFVVPPWRVELSMLLLVFLLLTLMVLGYIAVRLAVRAYSLPRYLRVQKRVRERERVVTDLHDSLKSLFSGRFDDAEKLARRAMSADAGDADIRHLAAALAAWSAHEGGNLPAALPYLEKITDENAMRMRDASKAYMLLAENRPTEALSILRTLALHEGNNIGVLKMKVEAEIATQEWQDVLLTVAALKRTGLMPTGAARDIALNAEIELMRARPANREALLDSWKRLDTLTRLSPLLCDVLTERLISAALYDDAARVIEEALDKTIESGWGEQQQSLIARYADCRVDNTVVQIEKAESWLKQQPRNAMILATLGRLCMRQSLWGKAQSYLEASVALQPTLAAHMTLARLMEQIGKPQEAMRHIKRSAELAG